MCGICGIVDYSGHPAQAKELNALLEPLIPRGPDAQGTWVHNNVAIGHRRLSIIDLSAEGNQPLWNEDESIALICNGEIYNYQELTKELIQKGHHFRSKSDSEVLIHLYEEFLDKPELFLQSVRGMFALAIWDQNRQRLLLARDRLGIKPLYVEHSPNKIRFSSLVSSFLNVPGNHYSIDYDSVYEYLRLLTIPEPNTMLNEVKALAPGTLLIHEPQKKQEFCYWSLPETALGIKRQEEADEWIHESFDEAIGLHLNSDVPLGSFLSAGVDSSIVTIQAAKQSSVTAFTATFPNEMENEEKDAKKTAQHFGISHQTLALDQGFLSGLRDTIPVMDQPLALGSALSLFQISNRASNEVKVVLSGDGGDEILAGYDHRHIPLYQPPIIGSFPARLQKNLGHLMYFFSDKILGNENSLTKIGNYCKQNFVERYLNRGVYVQNSLNVQQQLAPCHRGGINQRRYLERVENKYRESFGHDTLNRMLYIDICTSLVDEMLAKTDRMTMACGLEARVPFLDHKFVEVCMSIPGQFKRSSTIEGKRPLRNMLRKIGASSEIATRKKTGFNSPLGRLLNEDAKTKKVAQEFWSDSLECPLFEQNNNLRLFEGKLNESQWQMLFSKLIMGQWWKLAQNKPASLSG